MTPTVIPRHSKSTILGPRSNIPFVSRPGRSQELLYKLSDEVMVFGNIFTAPTHTSGWKWCFQLYNRLYYYFLGDSKSRSASKTLHWFTSYSDFGEQGDFTQCFSSNGKGLHLFYSILYLANSECYKYGKLRHTVTTAYSLQPTACPAGLL